MSVDELRVALSSEGRDWWQCECGRKLYEHHRRKLPNSGIDEYVCAQRDASGEFVMGRFRPVTLPELDYTPDRGLHRPQASG